MSSKTDPNLSEAELLEIVSKHGAKPPGSPDPAPRRKLQSPRHKKIDPSTVPEVNSLDDLRALFNNNARRAPIDPVRFTPPDQDAEAGAVTTVISPALNPDDFETDRWKQFSRRTGGPKKQPRGNTAPHQHRSTAYPPDYKPQGRKVWETIDEVLERPTVTAWVEGVTFVDSLDEPYPPDRRDPNHDPDVCVSTYDLLGHWVEECVGTGGQLTVACSSTDDVIPPPASDRERRKWAGKRVSQRDVHQHLHDAGTPLTVRRLADSLFGPFANVARRTQAEGKVRQHVYRLVGLDVVHKVDGEHGVTFWESVRPPDPTPAGTLAMTQNPEPKFGRIRLRVDGEIVIPFFLDDAQEALDHLARVCVPLGLTVCTVNNDPRDHDHPAERRRKRRVWPHIIRHHTAALDVLRDCRTGVYEAPIGPEARTFRPQKMLVTLGYWARMLYRPPPADSGSRLDYVTGSLNGYAPPDVEEQRYMERKAYNALRKLELKGQVVRRTAPDGRTVLFPFDDREADNHPLVTRHRS